MRQVRRYLSLNLLLVCAPLGFVASAYSWSPVAVFLYNFLAIIPLSGLISDASDTLSERWGGLLGGLVNASLGNTVELIVSESCHSFSVRKKLRRLMANHSHTRSACLPLRKTTSARRSRS